MTGYVIYNAEGVNPLVINTLFELLEVKGTFFYLGFFFSVFLPLIFFFLTTGFVFSVLSENYIEAIWQWGVCRGRKEHPSLWA